MRDFAPNQVRQLLGMSLHDFNQLVEDGVLQEYRFSGERRITWESVFFFRYGEFYADRTVEREEHPAPSAIAKMKKAVEKV